MLTQLKNVLSFVNLAPATPTTVPHNLNEYGKPVVPDFVVVPPDVTVTYTDEDVTVTNTSGGPISFDLFVERWHTIERQLGAQANLSVQPYEVILGGGGGGGGVVSVTAGAGLINSGSAANPVLDVVANPDGSIVVNANDIQVGVLATDGQHGVRGGGALHANATVLVAGFMSAADKTKLDGLPATAVATVTAGAGLINSGSATNPVLDVVGNADGSIVVNPDDVQVGVLATDAQHGNRGGGGIHALVVAGGAAGFMSGTDKTKLDGIGTGATVQSITGGTGISVTGTAAIPIVSVNQATNFAWTGNHTWTTLDAGTTNVTTPVMIDHTSSGVPAAGFGAGLQIDLHNAANALITAGSIGIRWNTATPGSETSQFFVQGLGTGAGPTDILLAQRDASGASLIYTGSTAAVSGYRIGSPGSFVASFISSGTAGRIDILTTSTRPLLRIGQSTASTSGAVRLIEYQPPNNTGQTAATEISAYTFNSFTRTWATGALVTQREVLWNPPTYAFNGASTVTTAALMAATSAPIAGSNATFTNHIVLQVGGAVAAGPASAGYSYRAIDVPDQTITLTGTTGVTATVGAAGIRIGTITVTDASAMTMDNAAALYIAGVPVAAGSAVITNAYSLWIDSGIPRIDSTSANGAVATVLGSVGPAGSNTTVQEWLTININGNVRYIPCW
jgi:hypothetical protein